jgi:hypothetical protein
MLIRGCGPGFPSLKVHISHAHTLHKIDGVPADHQVLFGISRLDDVIAGAFAQTFLNQRAWETDPSLLEIDKTIILCK